jgi:hypothetical protein
MAGKGTSGRLVRLPEQASRLFPVGLRFLYSVLCVSIVGCAALYPSPPPPTLRKMINPVEPDKLGLSICRDTPPCENGDKSCATQAASIIPVYVSVTNNTRELWTVEADQFFGEGRGSTKSSTPATDQTPSRIVPVPAKEAARLAGLSVFVRNEMAFGRAGTFAPYWAGLGAVFGTIAAEAGGGSLGDAAQLGVFCPSPENRQLTVIASRYIGSGSR